VSFRAATGTLRAATGAYLDFGTRLRSAGSAPVSATTFSASAMAYPSNAGMVNVVTAYGVVANSILAASANTAALNAAFAANDYKDADPARPHVARQAARTVFLPAGTIWINGGVGYIGSSIRILGAGETKTIIRLVDGASGFGNSGSPQYVLRTGEAGANAQENAGFSNFIHHLTIDTGANNLGAIGVRYSVANAGSMRHVTIKSSDTTKRGKYGIMFGTTAGPGLVADVTVDGFDYGIYSEGNSVNDIAFSNVTLKNQKIFGVQCTAKVLCFENLTVLNTPRAINVTDVAGVVFVDGLVASGPGAGPAVQLVAGAYAWLRNVTASGWTNLVTQGGVARFIGRTSLTEWGAVSYRRGNSAVPWGENSGYVSLNLPNKFAPEYHTSDLSKWARPQDYGYNGSGDVGPAINAAIADDKEIIYLPYGDYTLTSQVVLQGSLRVLDGMGSVLQRSGSGSLTVGNNSSGHPIIIQNITPEGLTFIHASNNTTVVKDLGNKNNYTLPTVRTAAPASGSLGDLFYESAGANQRAEITHPVDAWLRQVNRERAELIVSGGATVRVFADNVELSATDVEADVQISGSSTVEFLGASFDILGFTAYPASGKAVFSITNSTVSILTAGYMRSSGDIGHWLSDIRSGSSVGDITGTNVYTANTGTSHREVVQMYVSP
jgi:hypothetical protein